MDGIIVCWLKWWWKRDSIQACLVIIDLAQTMSDRDLQQMADYLVSMKGINNGTQSR